MAVVIIIWLPGLVHSLSLHSRPSKKGFLMNTCKYGLLWFLLYMTEHCVLPWLRSSTCCDLQQFQEHSLEPFLYVSCKLDCSADAFPHPTTDPEQEPIPAS